MFVIFIRNRGALDFSLRRKIERATAESFISLRVYELIECSRRYARRGEGARLLRYIMLLFRRRRDDVASSLDSVISTVGNILLRMERDTISSIRSGGIAEITAGHLDYYSCAVKFYISWDIVLCYNGNE